MKYLSLLTIFADEITDSIWAGIARFIMYIPNLIFLFVDAIVYSVLAYAYKLFEIMARLNYSSIQSWFKPILSNIENLTIVVVMFAIGYALISYLINPDKINDKKIGGTALIKNIAIAGILFIAKDVFFPLMDETTFLLIGAPEGYTYNRSILEQFGVTNDGGQGLIANVIYGNNGSGSDEETTDFGTSLAVNTLHVFLHSKYSGTVVDKAYQDAMEGKDFSLMGITAGFRHIEIFLENGKEGTIEYKYPVLSTLVGLFLVYTLGTIAIELGIRALKLIMLEVLAPIAIVTIIKDGWDAKIWKNWWSVYWKTYLDVFLRVASMYLIVGLIAKVFNNVSDLITDSVNSGSFTTYIVMIVIIIAGFKLAKELPKFIDDIFGSHLASNNKDGFKNFLKGIGTGLTTATGAAVGGIGGVATGIAASKANGLSAPAGAWNAVKGGIGGAVAGSKGKKISDHINNINKHKEGLRSSAETMKDRGGTLRSNMGYSFRNATGLNYAGQQKVKKAIKAEDTRTQGVKEHIRDDYQAAQNNTALDTQVANQTYQQARNTATVNAGTAAQTYQTSLQGIQARIAQENNDYTNTSQAIASNISTENSNHATAMTQYDTEISSRQTAIETANNNISSHKQKITDLENKVTANSYVDTVDDKGQTITAEQQRNNDKNEAIKLMKEVETFESDVKTYSEQITSIQSKKVVEKERHEREITRLSSEQTAERDRHESAIERLKSDEETAKATYEADMRQIENVEAQAKNDYETEMQRIQAREREDTRDYNQRIAAEEEQHNINVTGKDRYGQKVRGVTGLNDQMKHYGGKK